MVTQCKKEDVATEPEDQKENPLKFLGAKFNGESMDLSTTYKEVYAIYTTFMKLDYLMMELDDTNVCTDHRNFLFVFKHNEMEPGLGWNIVSKIQR